jgi:nucleoside-diphosphate-sugar epimerase
MALSGEKILVSGASGLVGLPVSTLLARENEVWGLARFANKAQRESLEQTGVTTRSIDLAAPDFSDLPDDFTYVLHLAWWRADLSLLDEAIRTNVEGPGLLLQHCRKAKAALVMSGMGVYTGNTDPWHAYTEADPIGRGATAYAATSPVCKVGVEAVARFCARAFELPVVIPRLNTLMGPTGSFPGMHIQAVLDGRAMTAPHDPNPHSPLHIEDLTSQLPAMLDAASVPATIVNWCGDEVVTAQEWVREASGLSGMNGQLAIRPPDPGSPTGTVADASRRRAITGPCRTDFWSSFRDLHDALANAGVPG